MLSSESLRPSHTRRETYNVVSSPVDSIEGKPTVRTARVATDEAWGPDVHACSVKATCNGTDTHTHTHTHTHTVQVLGMKLISASV